MFRHAAKLFPFFPNCPIFFSQLGKNIFLTGEVESCNLAILQSCILPHTHPRACVRARVIRFSVAYHPTHWAPLLPEGGEAGALQKLEVGKKFSVICPNKGF